MSEYKPAFEVSVTVRFKEDKYSGNEVCKHEVTVSQDLRNLKQALQDSIEQAMYGAREYVKQFNLEEAEEAEVPAWKDS